MYRIHFKIDISVYFTNI